MSGQKTCIGFGDREGRCGLPSDLVLNSSGLWCNRCEVARRKHIAAQLQDLKAHFAPVSPVDRQEDPDG